MAPARPSVLSFSTNAMDFVTDFRVSQQSPDIRSSVLSTSVSQLSESLEKYPAYLSIGRLFLYASRTRPVCRASQWHFSAALFLTERLASASMRI